MKKATIYSVWAISLVFVISVLIFSTAPKEVEATHPSTCDYGQNHGSPPAICDNRWSLQDQYYNGSYEDTTYYRIANSTAFTIGGLGISAESGINCSDFIDKSTADIKSTLQTYVSINGFDNKTHNLIILDIEEPVPVSRLYTEYAFNDDCPLTDMLLGYRRRAMAAKVVFGNATFSFYGIPALRADGDIGGPAFANQSLTYEWMTNTSTLDKVDYITPIMYLTYPPECDGNNQFESRLDFTYNTIDVARNITNSSGDQMKLAPVFGPVYRRNSSCGTEKNQINLSWIEEHDYMSIFSILQRNFTTNETDDMIIAWWSFKEDYDDLYDYMSNTTPAACGCDAPTT